MPLIAGIDCGSGFTKAVVLVGGNGEEPRVIGRGRVKSSANVDKVAHEALDQARLQTGLARCAIDYCVTTGFGRYGADWRDIQVTEVTAAARGALAFIRDSRYVLDIGAQSTRAIALTDAGRVGTFKCNDKCAAGSGSFIARAAKYLEIALDDVGDLSLRAENPQPISSVCAVLAESEIINHVSAGVSVDNILRGIHDSLADRAGMLLKRVAMHDSITLIGGVARQQGLVAAIEQRLHVKVHVPPEADYVCAHGAALLGLQRLTAKPKVAAAAVN